MTRDEEIEARAYGYACESPHGHAYNWTAHHDAFADGAKWADEHPSDETIMRVLNCIGYEERSWIDTVREKWDKTKED